MSDPFVLDQTYSCRDISRTLLSLQRLRVGTGIYNLDLEKSGVQRLGARFLEIVDRQSKSVPSVLGTTVNPPMRTDPAVMD